MEIAIGKGTEVDLWCNVVHITDDGCIFFDVINGKWKGSIGEGRLHIEATDQWRDADVIWQGQAPFSDYNDAIPWIESEIAKKNP